MQFDPQHYVVTEGDVVNITLVTNTSDYMFDFTVTLQSMDGSATGESFRNSQKHLAKDILTSYEVSTYCSDYSLPPSSIFHLQQVAVTMKMVLTL